MQDYQASEDSQGRRVLLVEDERTVLFLLARLLKRASYRVLLAASAQEALQILQTETVDVLLTDYRLSGQDGVWLAEQVSKGWPDVRIAVSSGGGRPADLPAAVAFMQKPFSSEELVGFIDSLTDGCKISAR